MESPEYGNHCGVGRFEVIAALCQGWETCWETMGVMGYRHRGKKCLAPPLLLVTVHRNPNIQYTVSARTSRKRYRQETVSCAHEL